MWSEARKHTVPHKKKTIIAIQELQCEQNLAAMLSTNSGSREIKYGGWLMDCMAMVPINLLLL